VPASETKEEGKTGRAQKRVCPACEESGHQRICCPKLSSEQRAEYESRCGNLQLLADSLEKAEHVKEVLPSGQASASDKVLAAGYKAAEANVRTKLHEILKELGMQSFIIAAPAAAVAEAKEDAKAKAKAKAEAEKAEKLAAKAAAQAEAKAKAKAEAEPKEDAKAKAKAKATMKTFLATAAKAKAKSIAKAKEPPEMRSERSISEGPAKGWSVSISSTGSESHSFMYREPSSVDWMGDKEASQAASSEVWARLQVVCGEMASKWPPSQMPAPAAPEKKRKASVGKSKPAPYPEEVREILQGPAKGWRVRGKAYKDATQYFVRKPGSSFWETRSAALQDADDQIHQAVEQERLMVQELLQKRVELAKNGQDPIEVSGSQSDSEPAPEPVPERAEPKVPEHPEPKRSGIKRLRIVTAPAPVEKETIEIGNSQDDPAQENGTSPARHSKRSGDDAQAELSHITQGAAMGWTVQVNLPPKGPSRWLFRRPQGTKYERLAAIRQGLGLAVVAALEAEQASMAARIGSDAGPEPLASAPQRSLQHVSSSPRQKAAQKETEQTFIESVSSRGRKRYIRVLDSTANKRKAPVRSATPPPAAVEPQDVS